MSDKVIKNIFFGIFFAVSFVVTFVWIRPNLKPNQYDSILATNAQLLVTAFVLTVTVLLVIGQLKAARCNSIYIASKPSRLLFLPVLGGFTGGIAVSLLGYWSSCPCTKEWLVWCSTFATLTCFLFLVPFYWYQRQQMTAPAIARGFLSWPRKVASPSRDTFRLVEAAFISATERKNYSLMKRIIDELVKEARHDKPYKECLIRLESYTHNDPFGNEVVRDALDELQGDKR